MARFLVVLYGVASYAVSLVTLLYAIGFVTGIGVPKSIDSGVPDGFLASLAINALLLGAFAIQHSVMARPAFKARWTRIVPPAIERSTYVLLASLLLLLLFWQWRPLTQVVWSFEGVAALALWILSALGWLIALLSTFMVSHWDLFGLRQVLLHYRDRAYHHIPFAQRGFYRLVRHPIMLGFIVAFWAQPVMTLGHLMFAFATTVYVFIALQFEERDLVATLGDAYRDYRARVPMLIPGLKGRPR